MTTPAVDSNNIPDENASREGAKEAVELMGRGRYRDAALIFERITNEDADNTAAVCNLGICLMRLEKWGLAGNAMRRYVDLAPEDPLGHLRLGMILRELGFPAKSLRVLNHALKKDPNSAIAWNQLGQTYLLMEKLGKARECFARAIRLRPNYTRALYGLAEIYERKGLAEPAIELCRKALADCPPGKAEEVRALLKRIEEKGK